MNILITGGLGHIGSHIVHNISSSYQITIVDNLYTQRYCSLFNLKNRIVFKDVNFFDIGSKDLENIDVVIHLAAISEAAGGVKNNELIDEINIEKTLEFISLVSKSSVKLFVFPSTASVYGNKTIMFEDEIDNLLPQSHYANSKLVIENKIRKLQNFNFVIFRFGTIFGFSPGMRFHTAINKFCYQAAFGKKISIWKNNLNLIRPYLGINDMFSAVELVLKTKDMWNNIYNVFTNNFSLLEVISIIENIKKIEIDYIDTPLINQTNYTLSMEKIKKFGFIPKDDLRQEIIKTLNCLSGF